jgi:diguanylate cyclase (GGDEF)-like protein/PAS domain S-box-containing protein
MKLDLSTVVFITSLIFATQTLAVFVQYRVNKTYSGLGWWLMGAIAQALGFLLMLALNVPSLFALSGLANPLVLLGQIFLAVGIIRFLDKRENPWTFISSFAVYIILYSFFIFIKNSMLGRSVVVWMASAVISLLIAYMLFHEKKRHFSSSATFTACVFLLYGLVEVGATVVAILLPPLSSYDDISQAPIRMIPFIIPVVGSILWTFGFIIMVNQRLNAENYEEKQKLRLIFDISPDAKLITRMSDGLLVDVNTGFLAMTGHSREEIVGHSIMDIGVWDSTEDRLCFMAELMSKGNAESKERVFKRKDGSLFDGAISGRVLTIHDQVHSISVINDITDRKRSEETIRHMATHDGLTDLPTMRLFRDRLSMAMSLSRRNRTAAAVMFLDLDGFKEVNDSYGHDAGDALLREVAKRLRSSVRETDTVARGGGDEFLIVITDLQSPENAASMAEKVLQALSCSYIFKGILLPVGASIGISLFPRDGEDIDQLIKLADEAMYKVKASGKIAYMVSAQNT